MFQSTHSLRSATSGSSACPVVHWFQSTHSLRSATFPGILTKCKPIVSIHALLAECDQSPQ
nr:MAG TPA: hypothetical protein [Caudoviricetes sp.]